MRRVAPLLLLVAATAAAADWNAAVAAYKKGDYTAALREFQAVLAENPNYSGAYFYVGACEEKLGRKREALEHYQKASQMEPANPTFALAFARLATEQGRAGEALKALELVKLDGLKGEQKALILVATARAKLALGDNQGALAAAQAATQAAGNSPDAWVTLGAVLSRLDRNAEAFNAYRRAFELNRDPGIAQAAANAGMRGARLAKGQEANALYAQAAAVAVKAYEKKPSAELALLAAEGFLGADRYDEALGWLDRVGADNALVTYYRAQCAQGKGDVQRAERLLREALGKQPDERLRRLIYNSLGFVLDKQKRYKEAEQAYQEAGNQTKVAEMRDKQQKYEQNLKADEEARRIEELRKAQEELRKLRGGAAPTPPPER